MSTLWNKNEATDEAIHRFTVGNDYITDLELLPSDILGTAAHTRMLGKVGLLKKDEVSKIIEKLGLLFSEATAQKLSIKPEQEDCHTFIEQHLTKELGELGEKVHTGRSRNDQVLLAMRLKLRAFVVSELSDLLAFTDVALKRAKETLQIEMPGYTHFQPAMPSSVGMWLHAFAENSLSLIRDGLALLELINLNPLGVGAGFGVSLPLDRGTVTTLLEFSAPQRNPIDVQNSRGRAELKVVRWCSDISALLEKLSFDLVLYSSAEFGFFSLPKAFTTGSSIMPQKHNPDVLELLRARASVVRGAEAELQGVIAKLPSNYHRDFQLTKDPVFRALRITKEGVPIASRVLNEFTINKSALEARMIPELYATYAAFRAVQAGATFREAYRTVAETVATKSLKIAECKDDLKTILADISNEISQADKELAKHTAATAKWEERLLKAMAVIKS